VTVLISKVADLSLGTIVSLCVFQESVFSSVSTRNFVVQVLAIFLFPCTIFKLIEELFLFTNCI
jgi:hypothetical protein